MAVIPPVLPSPTFHTFRAPAMAVVLPSAFTPFAHLPHSAQPSTLCTFTQAENDALLGDLTNTREELALAQIRLEATREELARSQGRVAVAAAAAAQSDARAAAATAAAAGAWAPACLRLLCVCVWEGVGACLHASPVCVCVSFVCVYDYMCV